MQLLCQLFIFSERSKDESVWKNFKKSERYCLHFNLGVAYEKAGKSALAISEYHKSLKENAYFVEGADQFQPHFDSIDYTSNRYLVFLWYLNDVAEGGETDFPDLGLRVTARAGRLLVFPPYWMFQHAGLPPRSNDKYIVSTYLMF